MSEVNKKIISLEVRGEYILGSGVSIGAQGSFDSVYLRIKFDDKWLGLNIYATWMDALGNVGDQQIVTALDLVDGQPNTYDIPVPQFATNHAGTVKLALSGYVIGGEAGKEIKSLLNTVSGAFRVLKSGAVKLDGGGVNATLAEQVASALGETINLLHDAQNKIVEFSEAEAERNAKVAEIEALVGDMDAAIDNLGNKIAETYATKTDLWALEEGLEDGHIMPRGAYSAVSDMEGNKIVDTYAKKNEVLDYQHIVFAPGSSDHHIMTQRATTDYVDQLGRSFMEGDLEVQIAVWAYGAAEAVTDNLGNVIDETYATKSEVSEQLGNIESALDELHNYAQSLVGGGTV